MKFSIVQIFLFITFVAAEIRFVQTRWIGLAICAIAIPVSLFAILASAFTSESKDGMLNVDANPAFTIWQRILIFCILNLLLVAILQSLFPNQENLRDW